ncbi:putative uncharacterized protein [Parachlamydia acanthamoebae UV-7]|uniref:Uncharacterized protein n=3 Tax=Parachlamydia acanthamoebae TaxID=83552 RepID=F8KVZ1_PARAV|nr:hypothetical protein [Parachlamydia acanthamoebae]KIA76196.1 hypothetical protein DB43_AQ00020 [Parachlamydia acanthamoebae]CCB85292.1 putative uncharacterized protein [Parachlamydia acanthamoebae UV-7]
MFYFRSLFSLALLTSLFICSQSHAFTRRPPPGVTFPIDNRTWVLNDSILPYGQEEIWLMPEENAKNHDEFITVKFYSQQSHMRDLTVKTKFSEGSEEYTNQRSKNKILIAVHNSLDDRFSMVCYLQGRKYLYEVMYTCPAEYISDADRRLWIERFEKLKEAPMIADPDWLVVKPSNVMLNEEKVNICLNTQLYNNALMDFSLQLPKSWRIAEKKSDVPHTSNIFGLKNQSCAFFSRLDSLVFGSVSAIPISNESGEKIQDIWEEVLASLKNDGINVVAEGPIKTYSGLKGNFLIIRGDDDLVCWTAAFTGNNKNYLVGAWTHSKNFNAVGKDVYQILRNFSLNGPLL